MIRPIRHALLASALASSPALAAPRLMHSFKAVAMSPTGTLVATIEADLPADEGIDPSYGIVLRRIDGTGAAVHVALPCQGPDCVPSSLAWAPDGQHLAFVLKQPKQSQRAVLQVGVDGKGATRLLAFDGTLQRLSYGPDGTLAVLATAGARKEPGATQAAAAMTGEIGVSEDEQRIATIDKGTLQYQSPSDLYVYEYDWQPSPTQPAPMRFVATAAHGNGDNNWWIARLYAVSNQAAHVLYTPPQRQQLASPVVSADGRSVAFIGGIMSDFGSTGGDAFRLSLDGPGMPPVLQNLTPNLRGSITGLSRSCGPGLTATALAGDNTELLAIGGADAGRVLWSGPETLAAAGWGPNIACGGGITAAIHQSFTRAPELEAVSLAQPGAQPGGQWRELTRANAGQSVPVTARSLTWRSDGFDVQGWLLSPAGAPTDINAARGPMIVSVHGGPSAANTPEYLTPRSESLFLLAAGYRVFLPNPRGSFGQGESFAQANVRDFGHGDLRDILSGVDAVERTVPVDDHRLGLIGYSYGGYMTMWTVTQTNRFKAAVAGAGISDWQSYYGENGIDEWMLPFFGASVYDDPAIYAKSSPITFIRQVHTPTFEFVGDADVECPMPQTQEFYHALHTLGVPTQFVVYAGQGHGMKDVKAQADSRRRTLAWFARYLVPARTP